MKDFLVGCSAVLAVPLGILFIYASLNISGFCFDKMRYLSDEEKFRILFEAVNQRDTIPIETENRGTQYYKQVKYKSFEQFMESNPDCCAIDPGGPYELPPPRFFDRITGFHSGEVIVREYTLHYFDENGEQRSQKFKTERVLQNCGSLKY